MYYDPLLDVHLTAPIAGALINTFYLAPQVPDEAAELFDLAAAGAGLTAPDPRLISPRMTAVALFLAREWGRDDLAERLAAAVDARYEPTFDSESGEWTWGLGLTEEHPRGQYNALLAAAEAVTPGAWHRLGNEQSDGGGPQVKGVDFPALALSEAVWVDGSLHLQLHPQSDAVVGRETLFRVEGLDRAGEYEVQGPARVSLDGNALVVSTEVGSHALRVTRAGA